jgi:sigma-B regulation protein RsbU (phosphoserine phosphatase)
MIRAVIVDDEEPARDRLRGMLAEVSGVEVVGEAGDGEQALRTIEARRPDLVFLDIEMPGLTGMAIAAGLSPPRPSIVFCTAYDRYAIEAFEHHALDYLLKPLTRSRLERAIERAPASLAERGSLRQEVLDASATQKRLLPQASPAIAGLDSAGACRPARELGGDFYDFAFLGADRLGIAVGDVSGKGLFAGLLMASLQARVQSAARGSSRSLGDVAAEWNRSLHAATADNRYATLFYGVWEREGGTLRFVNAGHPPPLLIRSGTAGARRPAAERLEPTGTVLGLLPEATYRERSARLAPGDILLLYTDGLVEARRGDDEFGEQRLAAVARGNATLSAGRIRDEVLAEVERFSDGAPPEDDVTLVVVKVAATA